MQDKIQIMRAAVEKLTKLLAGQGVRVTQRGSQAYVETDPKTLKPVRVNIPYIPDNASVDLILAIQGFIDHEVGHILFTDHSVWSEAMKIDVDRMGVEAFAKAREEGIMNGPMTTLLNIVEDPFVERGMRNKFPGSGYNIARLHEFFLSHVTKPALEKTLEIANDEERMMNQFQILIVPLVRFWAGQTVFGEFLEDYKEHPLLSRFISLCPADMNKRLLNVRSTQDSFEVARLMYDILYPPSKTTDDDGDADSDAKGDGKKGDAKGNKGKKGDGVDGADKSDVDKDADGKGDGKGRADDKDDVDEGTDEGADNEGDAGEKDNEGDAGEKDNEGDAGEKDNEGDAGEKDDGKDGAGEKDDADDADDEGDGKKDDADDEGDGKKDDADDEGDDADDDDGDDDGESESDEDGESESDEDEGGDEGEGDTGDEGAEGAAEDDPAEDDPGEDKGIVEGMPDMSSTISDFDDALAVRITADASQRISEAEYRVYTTDFDKIEPVNTISCNPSWVTQLEDKTRGMTGVMQKSIERMMAARSQIVRVPGHRSGRLHTAGLHRLMAGDDRVFRRLQENTSRDTAVSLVIDNSGSMAGAYYGAESKIEVAMTAAYALSSTLQRVGVTHECIGFTTYNHTSGMRETKTSMDKTHVTYSRLEPLYLPIYKGFDERLTPEIKRRFACGSKTISLANNVDGESILVAASRLMQRRETRKVMFVLSDGQPACHGVHREVVGHLHIAVEKIEKMGIDIVGIGIMDDSVRHYYPKHVVLDEIEALPGTVMNQIRNVLVA